MSESKRERIIRVRGTSMGTSNGVAKASISSGMLRKARTSMVTDGHVDDNGYPVVLNRQGLVDTIRKFCHIVAKRNGMDEDPSQVWVTVKETKEEHDGPSRYVIVIENEERLMQMPRTMAVIVVYKPTREMESLSVISDESIEWSADSPLTTDHTDRTVYYLGFISLMAEKTPGYDQEPEPQKEISVEELMQDVGGRVPDYLQEPIEIAGVPQETSEEVPPDGSQQQPEQKDKDKSYAGTWHNGKTKEEENQEESQLAEDMDLMADFADF